MAGVFPGDVSGAPERAVADGGDQLAGQDLGKVTPGTCRTAVRWRYWPGCSYTGWSRGSRCPGMSSAHTMPRVAGSRGRGSVVVTRWAWLTVAWVSSWMARRALPVVWPFSASARTVAALLVAAGVRVRPASAARAWRMAVSWAGV